LTPAFSTKTEKTFRIIPLGGLGEFGKNLMVYEYDDTILCVDAGLMFPEEDMPGVDIVIPDVTYLVQNADKVKAFILTHGHEDHIGALAYILPQINVPVYGTRLTLGLVRNKLRERRLLDQVDLRLIDEHSALEFGPFRIEFVHLCHSIPDAVGVVIRSPIGNILHVSDFKFDPNPVDGRLTDEAKLKALGDEGIRFLLSDSTNAEVAGFTPSELELEEVLEEIISQLALYRALTYVSSFDRPNIRYIISQAANARTQLLNFIDQNHAEDAGIVYCLSRKKVEDTADDFVLL
jgi:ribonuclease J